jgi:hypothetical protein
VLTNKSLIVLRQSYFGDFLFVYFTSISIVLVAISFRVISPRDLARLVTFTTNIKSLKNVSYPVINKRVVSYHGVVDFTTSGVDSTPFVVKLQQTFQNYHNARRDLPRRGKFLQRWGDFHHSSQRSYHVLSQKT